MSDDHPPQLDDLIIGGGIAGLWSLVTLRNAGRAAALVERSALGNGQSIWSQGIIHGGIKYALTGSATRAAAAIADMPRRWLDALAARGPVDLSAVKPLATSQVLWTTPGLVSRLAASAAAVAIRTAVDKLEPHDRPDPFNRTNVPRGVAVYRVAEPVLSSPAVLAALRALALPAIARGRVTAITRAADGALVTIHADEHALGAAHGAPAAPPITLRARRVILAAGAGNHDLLHLAGVPASAAPMQRRPLHMAVAIGPLPAIFGHCLTASTLPRLTITTVPLGADRAAWLIGGAVAESGVARSTEDQLAAVRAELAECLPWLDLSRIELRTGRVDRAEGLTAAGNRPDEPVIVPLESLTAVWPTKLAFAPAVADRLLELAPPPRSQPRDPGAPRTNAGAIPAEPLTPLPTADVAQPPWTGRPADPAAR